MKQHALLTPYALGMVLLAQTMFVKFSLQTQLVILEQIVFGTLINYHVLMINVQIMPLSHLVAQRQIVFGMVHPNAQLMFAHL